MKEEERLQQYVTKAGFTYWAPPERENKITNIRKWEQAFRVFAAIYCQANPARSVEIFQYVHTITSAAVSFAWENVYYYDVTFRQMMSDRPSCSWAKIYSQLWHTAMCDSLPKTNVNGGGSSKTGSGKFGDWRDRCCWRYNRGKCRKWNCPFDHRCTGCGSYSHYVKTCGKRKSGQQSQQLGNSHRRSRLRSKSRYPFCKGKKSKRN